MIIQKMYYELLNVPENTVQSPIVDILYETGETLPTFYGVGSAAYCYKGTDKGKYLVFDGETWIEQQAE